MKPAGYWPCYNEIIGALRDKPRWYQPFTEYFDVEKLDAIRDAYGADLYEGCHADALAAAIKMGNVLVHLMACGVTCKPVFAEDDCHHDFIAVFGLGNLTERRIAQIVEAAGPLCVFQRSCYGKETSG